jgi:hypothetical protein
MHVGWTMQIHASVHTYSMWILIQIEGSVETQLELVWDLILGRSVHMDGRPDPFRKTPPTLCEILDMSCTNDGSMFLANCFLRSVYTLAPCTATCCTYGRKSVWAGSHMTDFAIHERIKSLSLTLLS